jgi:chromosome partitioning protein
MGSSAMKTIALLSQKGGSGKSTIATHLAVCAARDGKGVAIFDIDPQASAMSWAQRRQSASPLVVKATSVQLPGLLKTAEAQHADLIIFDTAGRSDIASAHVIQVADLVLIPCRPSAADLDAIQDTIKLVTNANSTRAAVVLNQIPTRGSMGEEARSAISERMHVAPVGLYLRAAYSRAWNDGRSVEEYEPKGKAAAEIKALYRWILTT